MNQGQFTEKPEVELARIIKVHTDVSIPPDDLRTLLLTHWDRISNLAHAIHNAGPRSVRNRNYEGAW